MKDSESLGPHTVRSIPRLGPARGLRPVFPTPTRRSVPPRPEVAGGVPVCEPNRDRSHRSFALSSAHRRGSLALRRPAPPEWRMNRMSVTLCLLALAAMALYLLGG